MRYVGNFSVQQTVKLSEVGHDFSDVSKMESCVFICNSSIKTSLKHGRCERAKLKILHISIFSMTKNVMVVISELSVK
jgi:hypothetical protein